MEALNSEHLELIQQAKVLFSSASMGLAAASLLGVLYVARRVWLALYQPPAWSQTS